MRLQQIVPAHFKRKSTRQNRGRHNALRRLPAMNPSRRPRYLPAEYPGPDTNLKVTRGNKRLGDS